ncbi:MAG: UDP-glucose/GDP-mannose dehydrogenase family protein [Variovorax sp.]
MNITVLGTGYVGLVTGVCLSDVGNDVACFDIDTEKIARLRAGNSPIHEDGLPQLIERNLAAGRLRFIADPVAAVQHGDIIFIATGTPAGADGSADLGQVTAAAATIGRHMQGHKLVVQKSTVPVGTAQRLRSVIERELQERRVSADNGSDPHAFAIVSNPEFLKEGVAIDDFMRPDRIVIGTEESDAGLRAREVMRTLYAPFNRQRDRMLYMPLATAEFTKYAANAMLATRISFMNEMANLADQLGVDIELVRKGIGSDPRIGYSFLYAGLGYGGSCFPKDVRALIHTAAEHGRRLTVLEAVDSVNRQQKQVFIDKIVQRLGADLRRHVFAVWGLAFKPETDDMRDAPSRAVIAALLHRGATVVAHDPVANASARLAFQEDLGSEPALLERIDYTDAPMKAASGADALLILTDWTSFKSPNFVALKAALKQPLIFDGRNLYDPAIRGQGFEYIAMGR